jgi:(1->4)-alpha-D-glucan 1-alpha-D-glucosylmutase
MAAHGRAGAAWRSACTFQRLVDPTTTTARVPSATYRLQFNAAFTFSDALPVVAYLHALGISDAYASPYLRAVPGSPHGYDVADPTRLNPEIGTDEEYWRFIDALKRHGMGHVLDVVPNHMGIARSANPWWMDVLENGPSSRYARCFDITWRPVKDELADKVLIPTLGDQYGTVLEHQELALEYRDGSFVVRYYDHWFPIAPDTFGRILNPALAGWIAAEGPALDQADADELRSIITAAEHLPARSASDAEPIATRAREKEVVKRRLAALVDRRPLLGESIASTLVCLNGTAGQPRSFDRLDALLGEQSYRLAHWRTASEEINYRRFFDVNQLAALRVEDPEVFAEVHRFVFELVERGAATGLRIDHVDGLFDPSSYLRRIQERAAEALGTAPTSTKPLYVVVEKILGSDEQLPIDWPVHGTTGYEFGAAVNGLFVDSRQERALNRIYERFTSRRVPSFDDLAYACRKRVMHETMSGDINSLGHQLNRFSERNRHFRDFTLYSLISTIKEVIACFPVYRTYIAADAPIAEHDRRYVARAIRCAKQRSPGLTSLVFDFLARILLHETASASPEEQEEQQQFIGKFQQITSPVAAKGIEDTALYIYNRLLSLNEVGSDPTVFGVAPERVHQWMCDRRRRWPSALSATSTHDTKRGEDVRARLNALSEMPDEWRATLSRWRAMNRRLKHDVNGVTAPDSNEEYFIYQTLVGAWPSDPDAEHAFPERLRRYITKALREAKVNTSWLTPDEEYEGAVLSFVGGLLDYRRPFLNSFGAFQQRVAEVGMVNALSQLVIKCTAPGVPDFYQGSELWDLTFVDPDNRRPVDYRVRADLVDALRTTGATVEHAAALVDQRRSGHIKLFTMMRALEVRRTLEEVFAAGDYLRLTLTGSQASHAFAFARIRGADAAITCVPRLVYSLPGWGAAPLPTPGAWSDTVLELPPAIPGWSFTNAFTGEPVPVQSEGGRAVIRPGDLFARFPVAILMRQQQGQGTRDQDRDRG